MLSFCRALKETRSRTNTALCSLFVAKACTPSRGPTSAQSFTEVTATPPVPVTFLGSSSCSQIVQDFTSCGPIKARRPGLLCVSCYLLTHVNMGTVATWHMLDMTTHDFFRCCVFHCRVFLLLYDKLFERS